MNPQNAKTHMDVLSDDWWTQWNTHHNRKHSQTRNTLRIENGTLNLDRNEATAQTKITQTNWWFDDLEKFLVSTKTPWNKRKSRKHFGTARDQLSASRTLNFNVRALKFNAAYFQQPKNFLPEGKFTQINSDWDEIGQRGKDTCQEDNPKVRWGFSNFPQNAPTLTSWGI